MASGSKRYQIICCSFIIFMIYDLKYIKYNTGSLNFIRPQNECVTIQMYLNLVSKQIRYCVIIYSSLSFISVQLASAAPRGRCLNPLCNLRPVAAFSLPVWDVQSRSVARSSALVTDPGYMSRKIRKFGTDKFDT